MVRPLPAAPACRNCARRARGAARPRACVSSSAPHFLAACRGVRLSVCPRRLVSAGAGFLQGFEAARCLPRPRHARSTPHAASPGAPPPPPPQSFLQSMHAALSFFGKISFLVDENTQALHFFITAMLQLLDRAVRAQRAAQRLTSGALPRGASRRVAARRRALPCLPCLPCLPHPSPPCASKTCKQPQAQNLLARRAARHLLALPRGLACSAWAVAAPVAALGLLQRLGCCPACPGGRAPSGQRRRTLIDFLRATCS